MDENNNLNLPIANAEIDTNAEYISTKGIYDQPPIITSVFKSIFVEIPKEFYYGVKNFFLRYINLFKDGFKYLKYPSLKLEPFSHKDYKENCQQTFEFALIVIGLIIFLIKMDWISGQDTLKAVYNNDVSQAFIQFFIFVVFAVSYFVLVVLSVLVGRLFRVIFKLNMTRHESDILFAYLNNTLFLIACSISLVLRCFLSYEMVIDNDPLEYGLIIFYVLGFGILIFRWAMRFSLLNNINKGKRTPFQILATIIFATFLGISCTAITFFIFGV